MLRRLSAAVATIREDHAREDQTWKSCTGDGAGDWIQGHKGAWGRAANMRSSSKVNKVLAPSEAGPFVTSMAYRVPRSTALFWTTVSAGVKRLTHLNRAQP